MLAREIPETSSNPMCFAYAFLLMYVMTGIGSRVLTRQPTELLGLTHDKSNHNGALRMAFEQVLSDTQLLFHKQFTRFEVGTNVDDMRLQTVDLLAYENYKEISGKKAKRGRRKSLEMILAGRVTGTLRFFDEASLQEVGNVFRRMPEDVQANLRRACRVAFTSAADDEVR